MIADKRKGPGPKPGHEGHDSQRAGDGPGQVDALCSEAILLSPSDEAGALLDRAIALALQEERRPVAAIASLNQASEQLRRVGRVGESRSLAEVAPVFVWRT